VLEKRNDAKKKQKLEANKENAMEENDAKSKAKAKEKS